MEDMLWNTMQQFERVKADEHTVIWTDLRDE